MTGTLTFALFIAASFADICSMSQKKAEHMRMNESDTTSGEESRKWLLAKSGDLTFSPDGKSVAYINRTRPEDAEVWAGSRFGGRPLKRVLRGPIAFKEAVGAEKVDLQFSADGKKLLFLVPLSDTYYGLTELDLVTGKTKNLKTRVISYCSLYYGKEAGKLVAKLRKSHYFGVWSWLWLLDSNGDEIVPIGDDDAARFFFYELELVH